jgi:hypothetical protein
MLMTTALRVGDWVEVRPLGEVLKTLDQNGALDGLPFMPEMAKYCGQCFRVSSSAHKTCDPTGITDMRRMADAVHLGTRCDGASHGGCQMHCLFYWKTAWLKPVNDAAPLRPAPASAVSEAAVQSLAAHASYQTRAGIRYRCQGTEIIRATTLIARRSLGQYMRDIGSGNITLLYFLRHFSGQLGKAVFARLARLGRRSKPPSSCTARETPRATCATRLDLSPGEFVRIRGPKEIAATLAEKRGPGLEPEMLRHCGTRHRVLFRVDRVIDERTGKMLKLRDDCVVLDGITCAGLDNKARLFCPRACYYFWREAWLERAEDARTPAPSAISLSCRDEARP